MNGVWALQGWYKQGWYKQGWYSLTDHFLIPLAIKSRVCLSVYLRKGYGCGRVDESCADEFVHGIAGGWVVRFDGDSKLSKRAVRGDKREVPFPLPIGFPPYSVAA